MAELKLSKLPDRTPVKLMISIPPDLKRALDDLAAIHEAASVEAESIADLIPFMLVSFLEGDRALSRARRGNATLVPKP